MPRQARQKSETGIYHVILRGINRQMIFEDDEDNERIIELLKAYKIKCGYRLFAYCLMGNHIHLLLKIENEGLDLVLKRVAGSYAYWFNQKYKRSGHLFQDRFRSEAIENDRYFFAVLRYIHQNPIKAGLCEDVSDYIYSSYGDYSRGESVLVDIGYVFSMIDEKSFIELHSEGHDEKCMDVNNYDFRINDADAMAIIKTITMCENASDFQALDRGRRDLYIKALKSRGLSIRQISRLTGISFGLVRKA